MNAPVLTPGEQVEVSRFGIHDEDVIAWLDGKDETPSCVRGDAPATVRLVTRCCGTACLLCELHLDTNRTFAALASRATCRRCGVVMVGAAFYELYRVVPL